MMAWQASLNTGNISGAPAKLDAQTAERQETAEPSVHVYISIALNEVGLLTSANIDINRAGGLRSTGGGPRGKTIFDEA